MIVGITIYKYQMILHNYEKLVITYNKFNIQQSNLVHASNIYVIRFIIFSTQYSLNNLHLTGFEQHTVGYAYLIINTTGSAMVSMMDSHSCDQGSNPSKANHITRYALNNIQFCYLLQNCH